MGEGGLVMRRRVGFTLTSLQFQIVQIDVVYLLAIY